MNLKTELSPETLKGYDDQEKALAKVIMENLAESEKQREEKRASLNAIAEAKALIEQSEASIAEANNTIRQKTHEAQLAERKIEDIKANIATHEYSVKFNKMIQEQTPFWTAATARLERIQAELKEDLPDFADFIEAKEALTSIQKSAKDNPFTQWSVDVRTTVGNYERLLIDLVVDKLDGKKIRLARHQERNALLDRFLKSDSIERQWNRG